MEDRFYHYWLSQAKFDAKMRHELKGKCDDIAREFERDNRGLDEAAIKRRLDNCARLGIRLLLPGDELFEEVFGDLAQAGIHVPYLLFMKGNPDLLKMTGIAFVGSRKVTEYGGRVTKDLVASLQGEDVVVISGGAKGVDRIAHETALQFGLPTICVLGCGIGYVYPPENRVLFETISRIGLLLSEYEPGLPPQRYFFPERNRIIAQLSQYVVVTSAAARSGSLLTAEYAMDCNHEVLTVPYGIYEAVGEGCNFLWGTGARMITKKDDLREIVC